jgi:spore coat polysaccharide biosynthesis predicted glycosyltransferase SpsG
MAKLMAENDLCIGAAGSTSWERCCIGLPSIQLVLASNQKEAAQALTKRNAALSIDLSIHLTSDLKAILDAIDAQCMKTLTDRSVAICDGQGAKTLVDQLWCSDASNRKIYQ